MAFQKNKESIAYRTGPPVLERSIARNEASNAQGETRLRQQASHDPLTRLPNRDLVHELLERAIQRAERNRQLVAVLFLDVDGFAKINRASGHYGGDLILCRMAARLKSSLRKSDVVGRFGGDEFVVIVEALDDRDDVFPVLRTLTASLRQPVVTGHGEVKLECSIGISLCPTDGQDATTLVRKADEAMYQVKSNGRNGYSFYTLPA